MAGQLPGNPSKDMIARETPSVHLSKNPRSLTHKWYFTREAIEDHSPSRKDGIKYEEESELRKLYCSYLQELGMELKVPQVTIATAMMMCHRFYMHQSHAKNDWQTMATVSMFLACKTEETPRWLSDVAVVAYKLIYRWDPSAPQRIRQRDVYDKQKELIVAGERLLLSTVAYDLNVEHPYKPLVAALKKLEFTKQELAKLAWNFVNDWLRTTLCLQYKPHYIAAGSMFLAAKFEKVKLPTEKGNVWWMQFDVSPKQLQEVVHRMLGWLEMNQKQALPSMFWKAIESRPAVAIAMPNNSPQSAVVSGSNVAQCAGHGTTVGCGEIVKSAMSNNAQSCITSGSNVASYTGIGVRMDAGVVKSAISSSPQSCIMSSSNVTQDTDHGATVDGGGPVQSVISKCSENEASSNRHVSENGSSCNQTSDCGSANSAVEDGDDEPKAGESDQNSSTKIGSVQAGDSKINVNRIREALKRRRWDRTVNKKLVEAMDDEIDSQAWIERELENGIELGTASVDKRRRF